MVDAYLETISLIERLHRRFLDVVKAELERLGVDDINNVQSLILFNIGEEELTVGELTNRGYYLGTNVTYNLKKLVECDYVSQERSPRDRRSVRVRLTEKGLALRSRMADLYGRHAAALDEGAIDVEGLEGACTSLKALERFWSGVLTYGGLGTADVTEAA